ncbi:hypothetical protein V6N13_046294 [Hibiscus sabdariffa]
MQNPSSPFWHNMEATPAVNGLISGLAVVTYVAVGVEEGMKCGGNDDGGRYPDGSFRGCEWADWWLDTSYGATR